MMSLRKILRKQLCFRAQRLEKGLLSFIFTSPRRKASLLDLGGGGEIRPLPFFAL